MNAVLLAGGYGKRLRPLTSRKQKCTIEIAGKPVIRHIVERLIAVGFDDILIVGGFLHQQVEDVLKDYARIRFFVNWDMSPTACYLKVISDQLEDPFLLTNGDTLTELNLIDFIEFHLSNKNIATVFTHHNAIHSGGTYVFDKEALNYIEDGDNIPDLMQHLIDKEIPINLYKSPDKYFDIGEPYKLEKAREYYGK